jgi:hypothetical protein
VAFTTAPFASSTSSSACFSVGRLELGERREEGLHLPVVSGVAGARLLRVGHRPPVRAAGQGDGARGALELDGGDLLLRQLRHLELLHPDRHFLLTRREEGQQERSEDTDRDEGLLVHERFLGRRVKR